MSILNTLTKITSKTPKRVGRGAGSGAGGHTTGRGNKGQKVRYKIKMTFDGTKIKKSWIKRLPFLRGKHRTNSRSVSQIVSLTAIDKAYKKTETVDIASLSKKLHLSSVKPIKVLSGRLEKPLTFTNLCLSQKARDTITAVGGKIN